MKKTFITFLTLIASLNLFADECPALAGEYNQCKVTEYSSPYSDEDFEQPLSSVSIRQEGGAYTNHHGGNPLYQIKLAYSDVDLVSINPLEIIIVNETRKFSPDEGVNVTAKSSCKDDKLIQDVNIELPEMEGGEVDNVQVITELNGSILRITESSELMQENRVTECQLVSAD